ncbi:MAG: SRPBCC domain-containing protein [Puia sp.]|nr:SRPBCC domain-containing protein [Puia sp.]
MKDRIQHRYFFPHPPEMVWAYLTKAELMALWLMENDFLPIVGHDFQFRTRALPNLDFDGVVYCKVLEIKPFRRLSYSWKGGPGEGRITLDSLVVWTLTPVENGTELFLDHSGFKEPNNLSIYPAMNEGWLKNIQKIDGLIKMTPGV